MLNASRKPQRRANPHKRPNYFKIRGFIAIIAAIFLALPVHAANAPPSADIFEHFIKKDDLTSPLFDESIIEELQPNTLQQKEIIELIRQGVNELQKGEKENGLEKLQRAWSMDTSIPVAGVVIVTTYLQAQDYGTALEVARKIQKHTPNVPEGYTLAGIAYAGLGNQKQTQASFEKALEVRPGDPEASRNLAAIYLGQGNADKARSIFKAVLDHNPNHLQTTISLAELEYKSNQPEKAASLLESAIAKHPDKLEPRIDLVQLYLARNMPGQALAILEEAMKQFPDRPDLIQFAAVAQLKNGAPSKAVALLESAIKLASDNVTLHYNLALAYEQLKQNAKAMAEIDTALKLDPNHVSSKFVKARLMASGGQLDAAEKLLKELESSNPDRPEILELKGRIAAAQKRPEVAIALFESALKVNKESPLLVIDLALAQKQAGKIDASFATFNTWVDKHPTDISVRSVLADLLLDNGRLDEAQKRYTEIVKLQPERAGAWNNLAWLLAQKGALDEALKNAEQAYALAPNDPQVMDTLGDILLRKGQNKKAVDILHKASTILPDSTTISYHLAKALADSNTKESKDILKKLLSKKEAFRERKMTEELLTELEAK
jgi:putative PEP-CTERM system TPR-repeat lipoprotein